MKSEYLERIYETQETWNAATKMEQRVAGSFIRAKDRGFDIFTYDESLNRLTMGMSEFTAIMRTAGLVEFYYTGDWSNWQWDALELDEAGWKLLGIVRLENPEYKKDLERWGRSDRLETIPALRFRFKED